MKQFFFLLLLLEAFARQGLAQVPLFFTFDSIANPPYICQLHVFNVEVFGVKSSGSTQLNNQNYLVSNDTVYARFYFVGGLGTPATQPLYQNHIILAPFNFGVYKIVAQGFYNGQLHAQKTSLIGICSGISGVSEANKDLAVTVFPNPVQDYTQVKFPPSKSDTRLNLVDATGKTVLSRKIGPGNTEISLDLKNLPAGVYLLQTPEQPVCRRSEISKTVRNALFKA